MPRTFEFHSTGKAIGDALDELLVQRELRKQQVVENQLRQAQNARAERELGLQAADQGLRAEDQKLRKQQIEMQVTAAKAQQEAAAKAVRKAQNDLGVRQMIGEAMRQSPKGVTPELAHQIGVMGYTEDVEVPGIVSQALKPGEPFTLNRGDIRFSAQGDEVARGLAPEPPTPPAPRAQQFVYRNGQLIPIEVGTARPGDVPYDPVAERGQGEVEAGLDEQLTTIEDTARLAGELKTHRGFPTLFGGVMMSHLPTVRQETANAESILDSLQSTLALANTPKMKGVLSDSDILMLKRAATILSTRLDAKTARAELDRIATVMNAAAAKLRGRRTSGSGRPGQSPRDTEAPFDPAAWLQQNLPPPR